MIRENEREFKTKNRIKLFPKIRLKNIFQEFISREKNRT